MTADGPARDFWEAVFLAAMQSGMTVNSALEFADVSAEQWAKRFVPKPVAPAPKPPAPPPPPDTPADSIAGLPLGLIVIVDGKRMIKEVCDDDPLCSSCERVGFHLMPDPT